MELVPITSLIIATYNWAEALHCCLLSVSRQKLMPAEIIIADDGSDSRTLEVIALMQKIIRVPIVHVWHEDLGFRKTQILNKAIHRSIGQYLIQIDGDVLLDTFFVKDHLAAAETGTFIRGSRARLTAKKTAVLLKNPDTNIRFYSKGVYHRINAVRLPFLQELGRRKEMKSHNVRGSNMSFWKNDFIRINGYNNDLSGWGHEDQELATRFINNSIEKKIVKLSAVQFHLHHADLPQPNESYHSQVIEDTVLKNIKLCRNGYEIVH